MLNTNEIQSGFDAEIMLGKGWFLTAIQTLSQNGVLNLSIGTLTVTIDDIEIIDNPLWDFNLITSFGGAAQANLTISQGKFLFKTSLGQSFSIDIPSLPNLSKQSPRLQKVMGDNLHENAIALLLNFDIYAWPQDYILPLTITDDEKPTRGNVNNTISFLPKGEHIAVGIGKDTFQRFANHRWHTEMRAADGSHPLPSPQKKKQGDWKKVKVDTSSGSIKFILEGEVPIDIWPDADVTLKLKMIPKLTDEGKLVFAIDKDLDVDTGFWGDLLAFSIGALIQFTAILITGGGAAVLLPVTSALFSVCYLEIGEAIAEGVLTRRVILKDSNGKPINSLQCKEQILQYAYPKPPEDSIDTGFLDAIPNSLPLHTDVSDPLFNRVILVKNAFNDLKLDQDGLAVAGKSESSELYQIKIVTLNEAIYDGETLKQLMYKAPSENDNIVLDIQNISDRLKTNDIQPPLKYNSKINDPDFLLPNGQLCCPCLNPSHIRRHEGIITRIKFDNGLELNVQDAISLQDAGGIFLKGLQLIHPKNEKPYYRSQANKTNEDNLESLPEF